MQVRDHSGRYGTDEPHTGVWLSNRPFDENEDAASGALLAVESDEAVVTPLNGLQLRREIENVQADDHPGRLSNGSGNVIPACLARRDWPHHSPLHVPILAE